MPATLDTAMIELIALLIGIFLTGVALLFMWALSRKKDGNEW